MRQITPVLIIQNTTLMSGFFFAELSKHMGLIDQPVASLLIQVPGINVLDLTSLSIGLILCLTGHI